MKKVYLKFPYLRSLETKILSKKKIGEHYHVELEKTIFCPRIENICSHDKGYINTEPLFDVYCKENKIIHVVKNDLSDENVNLTLNWPYRKRMAEYLTMKFLLESFFTQFFELKNAKFFPHEYGATFSCENNTEISSLLSHLEDDMNHFIDSALPISLEEKYERMKSYTVKKYYGNIPSFGNLRLVHVLLSNTKELTGFSILKVTRNHNIISISFITGSDYKKKFDDLCDIKENYVLSLCKQWKNSHKIYIDLIDTGLHPYDFPPLGKEYVFVGDTYFEACLSEKNQLMLQPFSFQKQNYILRGTFQKNNREQFLKALEKIKK